MSKLPLTVLRDTRGNQITTLLLYKSYKKNQTTTQWDLVEQKSWPISAILRAKWLHPWTEKLRSQAVETMLTLTYFEDCNQQRLLLKNSTRSGGLHGDDLPYQKRNGWKFCASSSLKTWIYRNYGEFLKQGGQRQTVEVDDRSLMS